LLALIETGIRNRSRLRVALVALALRRWSQRRWYPRWRRSQSSYIVGAKTFANNMYCRADRAAACPRPDIRNSREGLGSNVIFDALASTISTSIRLFRHAVANHFSSHRYQAAPRNCLTT